MPKNKSKLFLSGKGYGNVSVGYYRTKISGNITYADQFKKAAIVLAEKIAESDHYNDLDACPIIFLFRHSIELYLKSIVLCWIDIKSLNNDINDNAIINDMKKSLDWHNLVDLLRYVEDAFANKWGLPSADHLPEEISSWEELKLMIYEIHELDKSSHSFRYPTNKNGQPSKPKNLVFNILDTSSKLNAICEFFEGCSIGFHELRHQQMEYFANLYKIERKESDIALL